MDGSSLLLDKADKLGVVILLCILVWVLNKQADRREEKVIALYEARITDLKAQVDDLERKYAELSKGKV